MPHLPPTVFGAQSESISVGGVPIFSGSHTPQGNAVVRADFVVPPSMSHTEQFLAGDNSSDVQRIRALFVKLTGSTSATVTLGASGEAIIMADGDVLAVSGRAAGSVTANLADSGFKQISVANSDIAAAARIQVLVITDADQL